MGSRYYNGQRVVALNTGFPTIIKLLIAVNIGVFIAEVLLPPSIVTLFGLSLDGVVNHWYAFQLLTYQFLHSPSDPGHLLFNMLGVYFFGSLFAERWGAAKFLGYYLLCGVGAGLFALAAQALLGSEFTITIGASGALYGLLIAFGMVYPNHQILLGFLVPVRAKHFVWITLGITLLYALANYQSMSWAAHLGGLFWGYFLMRQWYIPRRLLWDLHTLWIQIAGQFGARPPRREIRLPTVKRPPSASPGAGEGAGHLRVVGKDSDSGERKKTDYVH